MADISIKLTATVPGHPNLVQGSTVEIPPDYGQRDIDALAVRRIEDTAFALNFRHFRRAPAKQALLAATARLLAIRQWSGDLPEVFRDELREFLDVSNDEAQLRWGDNVEGE